MDDFGSEFPDLGDASDFVEDKKEETNKIQETSIQNHQHENPPFVDLSTSSIIPEDSSSITPDLDNWTGGNAGRGRRPFSGGVGSSNGGGGNGDGDKNNDDPYANITLDDVGGLKTQKEWLHNIILRPLQNPSTVIFPPPKGVLFYGPPGTGKTLLARAFGNDLSKQLDRPVAFFHRKGGDFLSKWFGESGQNIRQLFKEAKQKKPSIIFLDELDGVCPSRDAGRENLPFTSVVTTFLGEMDTLTPGEVFVFGATNRLEAVDPAMRRPGRFDKHLEFLPPDLEARKSIIARNVRKWKNSHPNDALLQEIGQATSGYTGADLDVLCRNVFYVAFQRHVPNGNLDIGLDGLQITHQDWVDALSTMKPSNNAVYGSNLYTPEPPEKNLLKLINSNVEELSNIVASHLESIKEGCGKWSKDQSGTAFDLLINTCLIKDQRQLMDHSLENYVMSGVFVQPKIENLYPIYRLSKEDIMNAPSHQNKRMVVEKIFDQVANSLNICILYIPNIDAIIVDCKGSAELLIEKFEQFRGKPVLILATVSTELENGEIKNLFTSNQSKCYMPKKPTLEERSEFFDIGSLIFPTLENCNNRNERKTKTTLDKLKNLQKLTIKATEGKSLESLLRLNDQMVVICASHVRVRDKSACIAEMSQLIYDYSKNKLN